MHIQVINAGKCMICGREIKIIAKRSNNKFPDIFFCQKCDPERRKKSKEAKDIDEADEEKE